MPDLDGIGPRRDVGNDVGAVCGTQCVVGIFDGKSPTFHVGVKSTLHHEQVACFPHGDALGQDGTRSIFDGLPGYEIFFSELFAHRQGDVEEDARTEL